MRATLPSGIARKVLFSALAFVLFFGLLEIALRVAGVRSLIETEDPSRGFSGLLSVYEARGDSYRTRDNAARGTFNDQAFQLRKPPGGVRIFVLGGSSAYGYPWDAGVAFSGLLSDLLRRTHPETAVEVINSAGISYAMHRLNIVADELLGYDPDIFIVYSGHNEFIEPGFFSALKRRGGARNRVELALAHTRVYSALRRILADPATDRSAAVEVAVRREESAVYNASEKAKIVAEYRANLSRLVSRALERGVRVLLVTVPCNLRDWRPERSIAAESLDGPARDRWNAALAQGRRRLEQGDGAGAAARLEQAVTLAPSHAEAQYLLGRAYEALQQWERARACYRLACDLDASPIRRLSAINDVLREVAVAQGIPLVDMDRIFEERSAHGLVGFELIEDYVHPNPAGHRLIAQQVWTALEAAGWLGAPAEASPELFAEVAEARPVPAAANATWFVNQAVILEGQGSHEQAIAKYRQALAVAPDHVGAMWNLALLLDRTGRTEEAARWVDAVLVRDSESAEARIKSAELLARLGRGEESGRQLERAAATAESPRDLNNTGLVLLSTGDLRGAADHLERAVELDPEYARAHMNLGSVYLAGGELARARASLERALGLQPDLAKAHYNLGLVEVRERRLAEAAAHFTHAVEIDPGYVRAHINLGNVCLQQRDPALARSHYERALELQPDSAETHNQLGQALAMLGDIPGARGHFRRAVEIQPDFEPALRNLRLADSQARR